MNPSVTDSTNAVGQDSFKWWFGIVENSTDKDDPALGRVKVRIFGYHSEDRKILPTEKLPWAVVLQPTTSAAVNGMGQSGNGLKGGSLVVGFFADGNDAQQPIVIGSLFAKLQEEGAIPNTIEDFENPGDIFMVHQNDTKEQSKTQPIQGIATETKTAPKEVAFKTEQVTSESNPMAQNVGVPIANGVKGPENTMFMQIELALTSLFNNFKTAEMYEYDSKLTQDVTVEQNFIPIGDTSKFPPNGIVTINGEKISYIKKNTHSLIDVQRGVFGTTAKEHKKGSKVVHDNKSKEKGKLISKVTNKVIDFKKDINRVMGIIRNLVSWLVNTIKSYLLSLISEILNSIVKAIKSKIPYTVRIIAEAILRVMNSIGCTLDVSIIDSIVDQIFNTINDAINNLLGNFIGAYESFVDSLQACVNNVFDTIMSVSSVIAGVVGLIKSISDMVPAVSAGSQAVQAGSLSVTAVNSIAGIISFLLNLLGIGCNRLPDEPDITDWSDYNGADNCGGGTPGVVYAPSTFSCADFSITEILGGLWAPIYSYNTVVNHGSGMFSERDVTPGYERHVEHHTKGSYTEYINDGSKKTVVSGNNYTVVMDDEHVNIRGKCTVTIEGDYHLKVNGNYHVEVNGEMSMNVGKESKFTYTGEHLSEYKNDSRLQAINGFAITASKLGLSTSGSIDMYTGTISTFCNEENHAVLGSYNVLSLFKNNFIGLDFTSIIGGLYTDVIGLSRNIMVGLNSETITGLSYTTIAGANNSLLAGGSIFGTAALTTNWQSGVGSSYWSGGFSIDETLGISTYDVLGLKNESTVGLTAETSLALGLDTQPLKIMVA
jgi:hypothetical protein